MSRSGTTVFTACVVAASAAALLTAGSAAAAGPAPARHVLLLSVDGMHQSDLIWYVDNHPRSALAGLMNHGSEFTAASTPFPSDSFPGLLGQLTGGNPKTTGIYYDVTYNHALIDPAASTAEVPPESVCAHAPLGANVPFDESLDRDGSRLDAGQGLPNLPADILQMTNAPATLIDPALLPIDPATCTRVYPHSYLQVNTVFEVAKSHGLRTAWADKHPAYEVLSGPSGGGLDDLFTPEVNSNADPAGDSWTDINRLTQRYDSYKVQAVRNQIRGLDHSGQFTVGMPAVFGMNFQSVSTAEKLPTSDGLPGGYNLQGTEPGPVLRDALDFIDAQVNGLVTTLAASGHSQDTTIILSAKHGQSPIDGASLKRIDDGAVIDGLNAAWAAQYPGQVQPLVAASLNDDGMLLWFSNGDRTALADGFATDFLQSYAGDGTGTDGSAKATDINSEPVPYDHAGLQAIHAGLDAVRFLGTTVSDQRVPDLIGIAQHGIVYTGKTGKIAEHGGDDPQDRNVPLLVAGPGVPHQTTAMPVETTQIAPTILALLGLSPLELQAVQIEHTAVLPVR